MVWAPVSRRSGIVVVADASAGRDAAPVSDLAGGGSLDGGLTEVERDAWVSVDAMAGEDAAGGTAGAGIGVIAGAGVEATTGFGAEVIGELGGMVAAGAVTAGATGDDGMGHAETVAAGGPDGVTAGDSG